MDKTEGEDMFKQGTKGKDLMDMHTTSPHAHDLSLLKEVPSFESELGISVP